jgi:hypothetical protein
MRMPCALGGRALSSATETKILRNNPMQRANGWLAASAQNAFALRNLEPRAAQDRAPFLRPGSGVGLSRSHPKKLINGEEMQ